MIMFARTERLLLRPGWREDAPALAAAIGDEAIVRNLATAPWPYNQPDADDYLARTEDSTLPNFLIFSRPIGAKRLVGSFGIMQGSLVEHPSEFTSLMLILYSVFCFQKTI